MPDLFENSIEIENIFLDFPHYNCFGCSPTHNWGFRLKFFYNNLEDFVFSIVNDPKEEMAGFPGILHGGFQGLLLDEIMFWAVFQKYQKITVTSRINIKYAKTVRTKSPLIIKSKVLKSLKDKIFTVLAWIESNNEKLSEAEGRFVAPNLEQFKEATKNQSIPQKFLKFF